MWYFHVMVHGTSYQQILWCEFKTLGFTFAHGFIKFKKYSKEQKKLNIEATSTKVSKFCCYKILFGFPEGFFANFKGSEAVN